MTTFQCYSVQKEETLKEAEKVLTNWQHSRL